ncbi:unnamed protein product [Closterium sp. NIES-54]
MDDQGVDAGVEDTLQVRLDGVRARHETGEYGEADLEILLLGTRAQWALEHPPPCPEADSASTSPRLVHNEGDSCNQKVCRGTPGAVEEGAAGNNTGSRCFGGKYSCSTPSAKAEAVAGVGAAGRLRSRLCGCNVQQDSSGSTAAPAGPINKQQKQGQVAAEAAAGGATLEAGGSCNFLTVFRHPLLPSPHSHERQ